jgi:hypothetical protein
MARKGENPFFIYFSLALKYVVLYPSKERKSWELVLGRIYQFSKNFS